MTPKLLFTRRDGRIRIHNDLAATGMKAGIVLPLHSSELIPLPRGGRLFMLPRRSPVGLDRKDISLIPGGGKEFAVAALLPSGYTATYSAAYHEEGKPATLPLYSYAAAAFLRGRPHVAAIQVDPERRHDQTRIRMSDVRTGIRAMKKRFPKNRLVGHLEKCAIRYGCAGAQNFFLSRYECPLPASPGCNAACAGCISCAPGERSFGGAQPRIAFPPTAEELAQIALYHIGRVRDSVVSFGQGCEGEPLLAARTIAQAIRLIRQETDRGVINLNTNGSKPDAVKRLRDAGLDSIRVSTNTAQKRYYAAYYRPRGYTFNDVLRSIKDMKQSGGFVSLNYLTMPGLVDSVDEFIALQRLIVPYRIDMIQWRNLAYDPVRYFRHIKAAPKIFIGVRTVMDMIGREFPHLMTGYFNPTRKRMFRGHR